MRILLTGRHGYIGSEFANIAMRRGHVITRLDYQEVVQKEHWFLDYDLAVNCAAYIPKPSVSLCDQNEPETVRGNVLLPFNLACICQRKDVPLIHFSTACLFDEKREYAERDAPIRGFKDHCGWYVRTKLMAESLVGDIEKHYIFRIRLPFDEQASERNYLSKLIAYPQVYDHLNSLSHRADCVNAALDLVERRAAYGTYHLANPGSISARRVCEKMLAAGLLSKMPEFVPGPCKGTTLSVDRLLSTGVNIRPVEEAVDDAIKNWRKA
jgi:dTDP-4-dehydrorhamnose reductase